MSWIIPAVYIALTVTVFKHGCEAQRVSVTTKKYSTSSDIDPLESLSCMEHELPSGYTDLTYRWEHNDIVLSRNDALVEADPSRFSLGNDGRELFIRNAVRDDGGRYTCRVLYRLGSDSQEVMNVSNSVIVSITRYLPPPNYPVCSISPVTGVTVGSEITFICDPGESNPPVTLYIESPDGYFSSSLGTYTWIVREHHIMTQFTCILTSNTFPSSRRSCFTTILIATTSLPSTPTSTPTPTPRYLMTDRIITPTGSTIPTEQSSGRVYTTSDHGYAGNSECNCIAITVLIAPIIISIVSIAAVVFLLLQNYQQKNVIASYDKVKANTTNQEVGETYMELQKKKTGSDEEYTDLNYQRKPEDAEQKTVYENSGFEQSAAEETDYANVV